MLLFYLENVFPSDPKIQFFAAAYARTKNVAMIN